MRDLRSRPFDEQPAKVLIRLTDLPESLKSSGTPVANVVRIGLTSAETSSRRAHPDLPVRCSVSDGVLEIVWLHRQDGQVPSRYAIYFHFATGDAEIESTGQPVGDGDPCFLPEAVPLRWDFDHDGRVDKVAVSGKVISFWPGKEGAKGESEPRARFIANWPGRIQLAGLDWNHDGFQDLLVGSESQIGVFLNSLGFSSRHWEKVEDVSSQETGLAPFLEYDWNRDGDPDRLTPDKKGIVCLLESSFQRQGYAPGMLLKVERKEDREVEKEFDIFSTVVAQADEKHPRNTEGDCLVLNDGSILLTYTRFDGGDSDFDRSVIIGRISKDGGKTWLEPRVLAQNPDGFRTTILSSLLRLADGRILHGYNRNRDHTDCTYYLRFSKDEGQSWGEEVRPLEQRCNAAVYNFAPLQLASGRILLPYVYTPDYSREDYWRINVLRSDDGGYRWSLSDNEVFAAQRGAMEPGLIELKDKSILMHFRTQMGRIYKSYSYDGGVSWTAAESMPIQAPEAPSAMARIPSTGDLLLVWNNHYQAGADHGGVRSPLTAAISKDEGRTWGYFHDIAGTPGHSYSYPSITFMRDRVLITHWDEMTPRRYSFMFTSIPLDWFYR